MLALFKAEFTRYGKWAVLLLIMQLLLWFYLSKISVLLDAGNVTVMAAQLVLLLSCFAFGLVQMYLHKRKSHWTQLLQRPLRCTKIYASLASAAIANIIIAVPLAWGLVVIGYDVFSTTVVDGRHYAFIFYSAGMALMAYFLGSFIMLSASRGAALLSLLLFAFLMPFDSNLWALFALLLMAIGYMVYLNVISFKPDLNTLPKSTFGLVLMAVPMQMAMVYVLVFIVVIFYHIPLAVMGEHPLMAEQKSTYEHWQQSVPSPQRISYLLTDGSSKMTDEDDKAWYGQQAKLAQFAVISTQKTNFAQPQQLPINDSQYGQSHNDSKTLWVFSHDQMMVQISDENSGEILAWLGKDKFVDDVNDITAANRFTQVPYLLQNRFIMTENTIFEFDFDDRLVSTKLQTQEPERFIGLPQLINNHVAIVSTTNTYLFARQSFFEPLEAITPMYELPHPVDVERISAIESYHLVDGFILSYMGEHYHGFDRPGIEAFYAQLEGPMNKIHRTEFVQHSFPAIVRHIGYIASPLYYPFYRSVLNIGETADNTSGTMMQKYARKMPTTVNIFAIVLQLLATGVVFLLASRNKLNTRRTLVWTGVTGLVGLPALLSFLLLNTISLRRL